MKYILIIIYFGYGGSTMTTAEFNTLEKCNQAGKIINEQLVLYNHSKYVCVEKGYEP